MRLLLASLLLRTVTSACTIDSVWLVDTANSNDLMTLPEVGDEVPDAELEDIKEYGSKISIRASATGCSAKCIKFEIFDEDNNLVVQRSESGESGGSVYAAGMSSNGEVYSANSISKRGPHKVKVCPNESCVPFQSVLGVAADVETDETGCKTVRFKHGDIPTNPFTIAAAKKFKNDPKPPKAFVYGRANGEKVKGAFMQWHKVTIAFSGPPASETGMTIPGTYRPPSVFPDYRLDVTFTHESGAKYVVPGFFHGDGDPGREGTAAGSTWLCHFTPEETGKYEWEAAFAQGTNVAQNGGGNPGGFFDGSKGKFKVRESNKSAPDIRSKGRLRATEKNHFQFANGEYFLKAGPDSPQNLLAYDDIDGTPNNNLYRKSYAPHEDDFDFDNDPTFGGGLGTGLAGAINYLSSKGMNAMSVTLLNVDGNDANVFPFIKPGLHLYYDISKLAQWGVIFDHAQAKGIMLRIKLQDADSENVLDIEERKLFYREMIARYGHNPAIVWDLGEDIVADKVEEYSKFIKDTDPYNSPISVRAWDADTAAAYASITTIDAISLHSDFESINELTTTWVNDSNGAGNSLAVSSDEQGNLDTGVKPQSVEGGQYDQVRQEALWGNLMGGGAGVQYFFGLSFDDSDVTLQDFRSRDVLWDQSRYALDFFSDNAIPFQDMKSDNSLVSEGCLGLVGVDKFVVYKTIGAATPKLDLPGSEATTYEVQWYNPRTGVMTAQGDVVSAGSGVDLGSDPDGDNKDWAILLLRSNR